MVFTNIMEEDEKLLWKKTEIILLLKMSTLHILEVLKNFKKMLFLLGIKAGYGYIKKVLVIGDGVQWDNKDL
ncbi:hypothetical protein [Anaerosalibacter massiliensis]|nr:hypothetical protein [Anaerosalibacter massiliensis]